MKGQTAPNNCYTELKTLLAAVMKDFIIHSLQEANEKLNSIPLIMNAENKILSCSNVVTPLVVVFYNKEFLDCYTILLIDSATSKTISYVSASKTGAGVYQHDELKRSDIMGFLEVCEVPDKDSPSFMEFFDNEGSHIEVAMFKTPKHLGRYVSFSSLDLALQALVKKEFDSNEFPKVNYSNKYSYIRNF